MDPANNGFFTSELWLRALESYAIGTHLTVKLFDAEERVVFGPVNPTPLFQLFEDKGYDPGILAECARRCLAQTDSRPAVMVSQVSGLTAIGASLMLEGNIVGAAVAGYAFVDFSQLSEVQRLAKNAGIQFERVWRVAREQKPIPQHRLMLNGELLQVLGDALLRENHRTRQYEEAVRELEGAARAKEQANREVREHEERLHKAEKMAAAGQLAASMAHEVNNPLAAVMNSLYLLEMQQSLDPTARLLVTTAAAELARVSRIVKQSLSYYRKGAVPHELDLGELVSESLQIFKEKLQRAGIEVKTSISTGAVLAGFSDELRQVIDNLLLNAMEAMLAGGRLSVSVHRSFDWSHRRRKGDHRGVRLTIADSGSGISKENRRKIFEPFFTTKAEKGTGLGLWILQGIIAKHEGAMKVRSSDAPGKSGTVISIFLPSHSRAQEKAKAPSSESVA